MSYQDYGLDRPFEKHTVIELRGLLEQRNISSRGNKPELIARLKASLEKEKEEERTEKEPEKVEKMKEDEPQSIEVESKEPETEKKRKDSPSRQTDESEITKKPKLDVQKEEVAPQNVKKDEIIIEETPKPSHETIKETVTEKKSEPILDKLIYFAILGLKRPYPLPSLKQLLPGHLSFWLNSIKSCCIVSFDKKSQAESAFNQFNEKVWPEDPHNKPLKVKYLSEEESKTLMKNDGKIEEKETTSGIVEEKPVNELDKRFQFTKTEPKLYYLPLTDAQADERDERQKRSNFIKNKTNQRYQRQQF